MAALSAIEQTGSDESSCELPRSDSHICLIHLTEHNAHEGKK